MLNIAWLANCVAVGQHALDMKRESLACHAQRFVERVALSHAARKVREAHAEAWCIICMNKRHVMHLMTLSRCLLLSPWRKMP